MSLQRPAKREVHLEPSDFRKWEPENCTECGQPTRHWLTPHVPLCPSCAEKPASPLVEKRGDVWMMSGKACQSCAREIAEAAMTAMHLDPSDFRLRDKVTIGIADKVGAMMDAAHEGLRLPFDGEVAGSPGPERCLQPTAREARMAAELGEFQQSLSVIPNYEDAPAAPVAGSPLNPGIASTVQWLQSVGFRTTDSGDGVTRDFGCDPDVPYVHMIVEPERLVEETRRLVSLLAAKGIVLEAANEDGSAPTVDGCFLPIPGIATISLWNVIVETENASTASPTT